MMRTVAAAGLFVVACMPAASAQQPTGNPIADAATPIFDATTEPMRRMPGSRISRSSASSITT